MRYLPDEHYAAPARTVVKVNTYNTSAAVSWIRREFHLGTPIGNLNRIIPTYSYKSFILLFYSDS